MTEFLSFLFVNHYHSSKSPHFSELYCQSTVSHPRRVLCYLYVSCRTVCKETSFVLPDCTALTSRIPCMHREQTAVESHHGVFVLREVPSAQTGGCSGLQLHQVGTCFEQTYGVPDSVPSDSLCWRKGNECLKRTLECQHANVDVH